MDPRARYHALLARHLRRPEGFLGRFLSRRLDRRNHDLIAAAVEALDPAAGSVVADIGFGGGVGLQLLLEAPGVEEAVGIDISSSMLAAARRRFGAELAAGRLRLDSGSLGEMPLRDASLDGALTVNTIYFLDDLGAALAELGRVLRPGGRLAIGIGDPDAMAEMPFTAHGFRLRPIAELELAIADSGLLLADHRRVGGGKAPAHLLLVESSDR